ncbi:uncharacterized protein LOC142332842 isoform X2 [Lycorma delicatula]
MSTGVQCLVATPSLVHCLLSKTMLDTDVTVSSDSLTAQLAVLTNKMWSGDYSSVQPADFKHSLGTHYPQFKDFRQHDCQEFLALLLDGLHEQMNCANSKLSTLVSSNNNMTEKMEYNNYNNNDEINSCDIKQKLDCSSNLQCSEYWSPKKGIIDSNNYSCNSNNNNNNNINGILLCKKELNDVKESTGFTTPQSLSVFTLQTSLQPNVNKNTIEAEQSDKKLFIANSNNSNNKVGGVSYTYNNNNNSNSYSGSKTNNFNNSNGVLLSDKLISGNEGNGGIGEVGGSGDAESLLMSSSDDHHNHWYSSTCLTDIQDIMKDAKTSNVNVLVTEQETNNEIRFDSDKFPKSENLLRRRETLNFSAFHIYDNNTGSSNNNNSCGKRVKSTVTHYNCVTEFREGLDLKRIKMHQLDSDDGEKEKNRLMEYQNIKSKTLDINLVEKNLRIECERKQRELDGGGHPIDVMAAVSEAVAGASSGYCAVSHAHNDKMHITATTDSSDRFLIADNADEDNSEGEKHWEKHLATNQSVIVDTFQGQFKSTVVCSGCKYVSVTYEPFMYLSVPLPHAMERQICVTFISGDISSNPIQYLITLNKRDKISELKEQLIQLLNKEDKNGLTIILAEVFDNHIAKILNDNHLIRYVDDINRSIYAFELLSIVTTSIVTNYDTMEQSTGDRDATLSSEVNMNGDDSNFCDFSPEKMWNSNNSDCYGIADDDQPVAISKSCTICLEEKESNMRRHIGCSCILCDGCVLSSFQHYGGESLMCPVCRVNLNPVTDFVSVDTIVPSYPVVRMLLVPVVYRIDLLGDGNNNKKTVKLFGHPNVIRLRNNITSEELYKVISNIVPYSLSYKILLVDGQGRHCSRCMFNEHCRGCAVNNTNGPLNLTTGDTLAVTFTELVDEPVIERDLSMASMRLQQPLTLYDCIQAFSQSEVLDKQNPWYCPKCQQNQCATKTLSVWRCPDYLIVYLKRFVFHDGMSTKLEDKVMFPFHGLNLSTSVSYTTVYDLYACVCHIGGVSAGHYTAYTQHPKTGEWHYYNDDVVIKQMPQEDDYSNAYILFYKKRGLSVVSEVNVNDGGEGCSSYNTI